MKKIFNFILVAGSMFMLSACHKAELVNLSKPTVQAGSPITSENLSGSLKGTLLAGKTYFFSSDITINDGDTVLMQAGVHLIAKGDGVSAATSPQITVNGTFISLGTKENPNWITVPEDKRTPANAFVGLWGGIVATPAATNAGKVYKGGDLILKWTHIEYAGGPSGAGNDPYKQGDPRYMILFNNIEKNFILEDSWLYASKDDMVRTTGGHISIMRNTFESSGTAGGEAFNMKSGTVGDLAYNVCIGQSTNSLKASNSGATTIQCNVNMYNNTMINGGWRQTKSGRGGSINYEENARGLIYNNLIVNCRFGLRVVNTTDLTNTKWGNNYYYGNSSGIVAQFTATDGVATFVATDIHGTAAKQNNPQFFGFDVDKFDYSTQTAAVSYTAQPAYLLTVGTSNFRLAANSPALGKGKTDFSPLKTVAATGDYGTTITLPGKDIGAYQSDGTGNQH